MIGASESPQIEIFRELAIVGDSECLSEFMEKVTRAVSGVWSSVEINPRDYGSNTLCFSTEKTDTHPAAKLWFARIQSNKLYVSNIVPSDMNKLTRGEYNQILLEFYDSFLRPISLGTRLQVSLEQDFVGLDHWLDEEAIRRLNSFSNMANKSTGAGHPLDERRWWLFLFYVHQKKFYPDFYPDILSRWLHEVLGWSESSADSLSGNYERTLRTLVQYDIYTETGSLPF